MLIEVNVEPRYWEDATVNGVEDIEGDLIPGRSGDQWIIKINGDTGQIEDWPQGTVADIHYKVCDAGTYKILLWDNVFFRNGYVPSFMCPEASGYGDYIIMHIDENGFIKNWKKPSLQIENKTYINGDLWK